MRISIGELLAGRRTAQRVAFCEHLEPPAEDVILPQPVEGELLLTRAGRAVMMTGRVHTVPGLANRHGWRPNSMPKILSSKWAPTRAST